MVNTSPGETGRETSEGPSLMLSTATDRRTVTIPAAEIRTGDVIDNVWQRFVVVNVTIGSQTDPLDDRVRITYRYLDDRDLVRAETFTVRPEATLRVRTDETAADYAPLVDALVGSTAR